MVHKNQPMPIGMEMYEYPGYVREDFIRAANSTSMLNEEMRVGMMSDGKDTARDHVLKDFAKTIEYLEGQGDVVNAAILRDEMARYR